MKKFIVSVAMACAVVVFMSGCAGISPVAGGSMGMVYTSTSDGVAVRSDGGFDKIGTANPHKIIYV
jgi:hypothetical protein